MQTPHERGVTFVDVIIGAALMLVVFVGIFGVIQLSVRMVGLSKGRVGALALANEQMEFVRSLPYDEVAVVGGIPAGSIPQLETITLNNITYMRRTLVQFIDAPQDGTATTSPADVIPNDYKVAKVDVSWDFKGNTRTVSLISTIVPKGLETPLDGGVLMITVLDALGMPVSGADVQVVNDVVSPAVDVTVGTNLAGTAIFPGAPTSTAAYEIVVSKSGYSTDQTYVATSTNPNPNPGHLTVIDDTITFGTFQIDSLSTKTVRTFEPIRHATWTDDFLDTNQVATTSSTTIASGRVRLTLGISTYRTPGMIGSVGTTSPYLYEWQELSWNDTVPASTSIMYQLEYLDSGLGYALIPDADLSGNSTGFSSSAGSVDLTNVSTTTYSTLRAVAILATEDTLITPSLEGWSLTFREGPIPLPNIPFSMQGNKTIGSTASSTPIYKYQEALNTATSGAVTLTDLEWDAYSIALNPSVVGKDVGHICPPQPFGLDPGVDATTDIILVPQSSHSLLVVVRDDTASLVEAASVRLTRTGYDQTQETSPCGQTFFDTLTSASNYVAEVSAPGYETATTSVSVSGPTKLSFIIDPI